MAGEDTHHPSRLPRTLAALGAITVLAAAGLQMYGADGPWPMMCAGGALLALVGAFWPSGQARPAAERRERIAPGESMQQLRDELEKHKRLERELITA